MTESLHPRAERVGAMTVLDTLDTSFDVSLSPSVSTARLDAPATRSGVARARTIAAAAVVFPAGVLLHEAAHYVAARAFGFRAVALHYGSVSYGHDDAFWHAIRTGHRDAARLLLDPAHVAVVSALGPLVTYAMLAACLWVAGRRGDASSEPTRAEPRARWSAVLGLGLATPLRSIVAAPILVIIALGRHGPSGTDEGQVTAITGVPELVFQLIGLGALLGGWYLLLRAAARLGGRGYAARVLLGTILGAVAYIGLLGPRLLP